MNAPDVAPGMLRNLRVIPMTCGAKSSASSHNPTGLTPFQKATCSLLERPKPARRSTPWDTATLTAFRLTKKPDLCTGATLALTATNRWKAVARKVLTKLVRRAKRVTSVGLISLATISLIPTTILRPKNRAPCTTSMHRSINHQTIPA